MHEIYSGFQTESCLFVKFGLLNCRIGLHVNTATVRWCHPRGALPRAEGDIITMNDIVSALQCRDNVRACQCSPICACWTCRYVSMASSVRFSRSRCIVLLCMSVFLGRSQPSILGQVHEHFEIIWLFRIRQQ